MTAPFLRSTLRGTSRPASRTLRPNQLLFVALALLLVFAPLPLASARAVFWGVNAIYVGALAGLYFLWLGLAGRTLPVQTRSLWVVGACFAALCLFLAAQLALGLSLAPGMTLLMLLRHLTYGLFFLLLLQVLAREDRRLRLLTILLVAITAYAAWGLVSLRTGDTILGMDKWAYQGVATGTFTNRNAFATFLAMGATIAATRLGAGIAERRHSRPDLQGMLLPALAMGVIVLALLATQSRMGIFVGAVGILLGLLLTLARAWRTWQVLTGGLVAIAVVTIPFLAYFGDTLIDRLGSLEGSASGRASLYAQVLQLIGLRPWTGFGGGSFELAFPLVHTLPVDPAVTWDRAHNIYLSLWSETGLLAGSIPIAIVAFFAVTIAFRFRKASRPANIIPQATALAVVSIVALHSMVDFGLEIQANAFMFLAVLANGVASAIPPSTASGGDRP
jgi:O-antigen ligase